ncbi:unnamed protein product, partial [Ectocarpus sp. 12 AP-2014]
AEETERELERLLCGPSRRIRSAVSTLFARLSVIQADASGNSKTVIIRPRFSPNTRTPFMIYVNTFYNTVYDMEEIHPRKAVSVCVRVSAVSAVFALQALWRFSIGSLQPIWS